MDYFINFVIILWLEIYKKILKVEYKIYNIFFSFIYSTQYFFKTGKLIILLYFYHVYIIFYGNVVLIQNLITTI